MKAAIFDLDGTLVDSLPGLAASLNHTLTSEGLPEIHLSTVRGYVGNGLWQLIRCAFPTSDYPDEAITRLRGTFEKHYAQVWQDTTTPFEGIIDLLHSLHANGVTLGVLSNKQHSFTQDIVSTLFGRDLMPVIYGQRDGIAKKPAPDALLAICQELTLSPTEVTFIGDSTVDLATAQAAKTKGAGVTWGYHDQSQLSPYGYPLCDTVTDLKTMLLSEVA